MTPREKFVTDAIAGGWEHKMPPVDFELLFVPMLSKKENVAQTVRMLEILDDTKAWTAVAKSRGGQGTDKMHRFHAYLADGKGIDEALALL